MLRVEVVMEIRILHWHGGISRHDGSHGPNPLRTQVRIDYDLAEEHHYRCRPKPSGECRLKRDRRIDA